MPTTLPPEIWSLILQPCYYDWAALKPFERDRVLLLQPKIQHYSDLRRVDRLFNSIVSEYVFRDLINPCHAGFNFERLERISQTSRLANFVKSYTWSSTKTLRQWDLMQSVLDNQYLLHLAFRDLPEERETELMRQSENITCLSTNKIFDKHIEILMRLPNLVTLTLERAGDGQDDMIIPASSADLDRAAIQVFRAMLHVCYLKQSYARHKPITSFTAQSLDACCTLLPLPEMQQACHGMRSLENVDLSFINDQAPEDLDSVETAWIAILGRLVQSATQLKSLKLRDSLAGLDHDESDEDDENDEDDLDVDIVIDNIFITFNFQPTSSKLMIWPHLTTLSLDGFEVGHRVLTIFLREHKSTLRHITLQSCLLHRFYYSQNIAWEFILADFFQAAPQGQRLDSAVFMKLKPAKASDLTPWQDWLTGKRDVCPDGSSTYCNSEIKDLDRFLKEGKISANPVVLRNAVFRHDVVEDDEVVYDM